MFFLPISLGISHGSHRFRGLMPIECVKSWLAFLRGHQLHLFSWLGLFSWLALKQSMETFIVQLIFLFAPQIQILHIEKDDRIQICKTFFILPTKTWALYLCITSDQTSLVSQLNAWVNRVMFTLCIGYTLHVPWKWLWASFQIVPNFMVLYTQHQLITLIWWIWCFLHYKGLVTTWLTTQSGDDDRTTEHFKFISKFREQV